MPDPRAAGQVAYIVARGTEEAAQGAAADGGTLTASQRYWVEVGVAWGMVATLETLSEAGWLTGPRCGDDSSTGS